MITSSEHRGNLVVLTSEVALAQMFGYSTAVRSLSQGRASYSMEFSHYDEAPASVLKEMLG
jgi:elongation factor G